MGFDGTIGSNYEKEFLDAKLRCNRRGAHFSFGSDNVEGRILKLQGFLNIRHDSTVRIRIHGCPNLSRQLEQYRWDNDKGQPSSKPAKRQQIDVAQCLEYFCSRSDCGYVRPPKVQTLDKKSAESVRKAIGSLFSAQPKPTETSVYIGAGERPII